MEQAETLRTIAEVAVAIAGFTGVVLVFGHRARGDWTHLEAFRLWMLLAQALIAMLLSFLPILIHSAGLPDTAVWRLSNGAFATSLAAIGAHMVFRQRAFTHHSRSTLGARWFIYATFTTGTLIVVAQSAYAVGILRVRGSFLFLLGLLFIVAMAASNFWQLLMGSMTVRNR